MMATQNQLLTHVVKTIRYRFLSATNGAGERFGDFKINEATRSPKEIINHMFDLTTKTISMLTQGHFGTLPPPQLDFQQEQQRFLAGLDDLQHCLNSMTPEEEKAKKLLQGPLLDMVTHIGQLAMLNGFHGHKVPKESYYDLRLE